MITLSVLLVEASTETGRVWVSVGERGLVSLPVDRATAKKMKELVGNELRLTLAEVERDPTAVMFGASEMEVDHG